MRRVVIVVLAAALVVVPPAGAWTWPAKGPVLQKFVLGDDPYAAGQHRGIDIGLPQARPSPHRRRAPLRSRAPCPSVAGQ